MESVAKTLTLEGYTSILRGVSGGWESGVPPIQEYGWSAAATSLPFPSIATPAVLRFDAGKLATLSLSSISNAAIYFRPRKFRHGLHAGNGSRHPVSSTIVLVLNALYGCMTAHPFCCVTSDLFGEDHDDVHRTPFADPGCAFQEDA